MVPVGDSCAATVGDGAAAPAEAGGAAVAPPTGRGVRCGETATLDGVGVDTLAGGHTPAGEAGGDVSLCPSYRNPSASPSAKVWLEMPRLDDVHPLPPRLTYSAQYGLLAVQHPGGYEAGSPSIWHTALPAPAKSTVAYSTWLMASTWSPVSEPAEKATHALTVVPLACSTTKATWCSPAASAQPGEAPPLLVAAAASVNGTHSAAAAATRRLARTAERSPTSPGSCVAGSR